MFTNSLGDCLLSFWKNYFGWGRASRSEYWLGVLFWGALPIALFNAMLPQMAEDAVFMLRVNMIFLVYAFLIIIPMICLYVRRWHDTGRSGWWPLLLGCIPVIGGIIALVFMCLPGDPESNRYGAPRV